MKNKKQNKIQPQKEDVSKLIRDKNFLLGLGVFVVLLLGLGFGITRYSNSLKQNNMNVKNPIAAQTKVGEDSKTSTSAAIVAQQEAKKDATASSALSIKELPNTEGVAYHTVSTNENFWKISKLNCGTGIYYLSIKQYNGYEYRTLRPGDILTIVCSQ